MNGNVLAADVFNLCPCIPLQRKDHIVNILCAPFGLHFDRAVPEIAHPAGYAEIGSGLPCPVPESDALYVAGKDDMSADFLHAFTLLNLICDHCITEPEKGQAQR